MNEQQADDIICFAQDISEGLATILEEMDYSPNHIKPAIEQAAEHWHRMLVGMKINGINLETFTRMKSVVLNLLEHVEKEINDDEYLTAKYCERLGTMDSIESIVFMISASMTGPVLCL